MKILLIDDLINWMDIEKEPVNHPKLAVIVFSMFSLFIIFITIIPLMSMLQYGVSIQNIAALVVMVGMSIGFIRITQGLIRYQKNGKWLKVDENNEG